MTTTAQRLPTPMSSRRSLLDWAFAALLTAVSLWAFNRYNGSMDVYEKGILLCAIPAGIALGWFWGPLRGLMVGSGLAAATAMALYQRQTDGFGVDLAAGEQVFWLKYMLSSQSAIMWMSVLFYMGTLSYWLGLILRRQTPLVLGSRLTWAGVFMALVGTFVRWFESHQIAPDIGHIPVSNLYEVFVLFSWMTALFWLYYEDRFKRAAACRLGRVCDAGGQRVGQLPALVCAGPRRQQHPAAGAGAAKLVDEDPRASQLCGLRHVCAVGHGGAGLPAQDGHAQGPVDRAGRGARGDDCLALAGLCHAG